MNRRTAAIIIAAFVVIALVPAIVWWQRSAADDALSASDSATDSAISAAVPFDLYFPGPSSRLIPERRQIAVPSEPTAKARVLVEALLTGSRSDELMAPFPEGVTLTQIYLGSDGVAYVDFAAEGAEQPPASGSAMEALRVYSVVNSIALNVPEIRRVVLLWNGQQPASFAGHIDTMIPLLPRTDLIER